MSVERAAALIDLKRPAEALQALAESGEESTTARAHGLRTQALLSLGRLKEAEQSAGMVRAAAPAWEWGYRLGAIAAMRRGSLRRARELAEEAVRIDPQEPLTHQVLTITLLNLGDLGTARQHSETMRELAPDLALSHETHGRVVLAQGFYGEAVTSLRTALELDPQDADCMSLLADATAALGDADAARDLRLNALRSDPQNPDRQRDLLRRGSAVAVGGIFVFGKLGILGKLFLLNGTIQLGKLFGGDTAETDGGDSVLSGLLVTALLVYLIAFTVSRYRRHRHGKRLPPLVWAGLKPHRRNSNLLWLAWPSAIILGAGVVATLVAALRDRNVTGPVAVTAVCLALLALCWRARAGAARQLSFSTELRRVAGGIVVAPRVLASRRGGTPPTDAEAGPGPSVEQRWRRGAAQLLAVVMVATLLGNNVNPLLALPGGILAAGALAAVVDALPRRIDGVTYVVCVDGTTLPASRWRLALRGNLRIVLLPLTAVHILGRASRPMRLLHDRLSGTTVTGLRSREGQT